MKNRPVEDEPEPIEAEYEPASDAPPAQPRRVIPRPMRSRAATLPQLVLASLFAATAGATVAIVVSNTSSGAPTGTLAREIDLLNQTQSELLARVGQAGADIVSLRARIDTQGDRLDQQAASEAALKAELAALTSQISALIGAGDGEVPAATDAARSPLGVLLSRINRLEGIVANDKTAPATTREVQRAIADLASQVTALDLANTTLVAAFDRREAALAALETGLETLAGDVATLRGVARPAARTAPPARSSEVASAAADASVQPVLAASARAQAIRALSQLEAAARGDKPLSREHQALFALLPDERELADMGEVARSGAPTLGQLREQFLAAGERALRLAGEESDDGWNWLRTAFAGVVEFEPSELVRSNGDVIRNARRLLDFGDVRGAIEALTGVKGMAGEAFRTWRGQAVKRAALDQSLRNINARLLGAVASAATAG